MRFLVFLLLAAMIAMGIGGVYYYFQEYRPAIDKYDVLVRENKTLTDVIYSLRTELEKKESTTAAISDTLNVRASDTSNIIFMGTKLTLEAGNLFDAGGFELNKKGRGLLRKTAEILMRISDAEIVVEGHTDNEKIGPRMKGTIPSNWELSALRAINVVKFLHDSLNIPNNRLSAVAYGETRPVADNSTEDGKKKNRRIEILLKNNIENAVINEEKIEEE